MVPPELAPHIAKLDLDTLLADEALRIREFPVASRAAFLAHAAVSPLPARVVASMVGFIQKCSEEGQFQHLYSDIENQARVLAALLIGVEADEIAFVPSTSAGLSSMVAGLRWEPRDNVVVADADFPSTIYAARTVEHLGVTLRRVPNPAFDELSIRDLIPYVDSNTRLVLLSSVNYVTGSPISMGEIGEWLRQRNILFGVDAIQSLGAVPVSGFDVDFLCADGHKWLLAPQGCAILYVNRRRLLGIRPILEGWKSVPDPRDYQRLQDPITRSAKRFEPGSLNAIGLVGLHAALQLLLGVGIEKICARLSKLRARLEAELCARGYVVLGPPKLTSATPITSFQSPQKDIGSIYRELNEAKIIVSLRHDSSGSKIIRVAPHIYNHDSDIERLLQHL
ncbi:MAG: aminotransferase class V-fold PLP-dependent enzyme [Bryobacteraceae bacterium]